MKGIHASLLRAAAKSWQPLLFDVSVRYASCKKDYTYDLSVMRSDILPRDGTLDKIAEALYPEDGPLDICPVKVYENCFDRAISKAIFGHEERHVELRVMTILELVKKFEKVCVTGILRQDVFSSHKCTTICCGDVSIRQITCTGKFSQVDSE